MSELAVAVGVFDGVHLGHRQVLRALRAAGTPRVVTFDPHPVVGTALLCSTARRLELLREAGIDDVAVAGADTLTDLTEVTLVGGPGARATRAPDLRVPLVEGVSSELIRRLVAAHELEAAAKLLGRPFELEGIVVTGTRRGRGLGFPTANLQVDRQLLVPPNGIYGGAALGRRAAISVGVSPHYGGIERRIEAHVLDLDDDLYGRSLRVELWSFLRDESAFASDAALVEQIARDVDAVRTAVPPAGSTQVL